MELMMYDVEQFDQRIKQRQVKVYMYNEFFNF